MFVRVRRGSTKSPAASAFSALTDARRTNVVAARAAAAPVRRVSPLPHRLENLRDGTIQRTITLTREQTVWTDPADALHALVASNSSISTQLAQPLLAALNEGNEVYHDFKNFVAEVRHGVAYFEERDAKKVNPQQWAVLHRLKAGTFNNLMNAIAPLLGTTAEALKAQHEETGSKYAPSPHTWDAKWRG